MTLRVHGGFIDTDGDRAPLLDFSANLNPYGPPPSVLIASASADLSRYPDPDYRALRRALAARLNVDERQVLPGNGSTELLFLLSRALLSPGDTALLLTPCFGDYRAAVEAASGRIATVEAAEARGFAWDMDEVMAVIAAQRPSLIFLGQPSNPTGVYTSREDARRLAAAMPDGVLVLDEAFVDFVAQPWRSPRLAPNVVTVRSFTKMFTIPGLRAGYLIASRAIVERVRRQQPTWSVGAPAVAAALACLGEDPFAAASARSLRSDRAALASALTAAGLPVVEGEANFIMVRVGDAGLVSARLLKLGIAVRDCASFGLPAYSRVAVRRTEENARLVEALREVVP